MKAILEGHTFPFTVPQGFRITPEQFEQLAAAEQLARLELTKDGELIVMSPQSVRSDRRLATTGNADALRGGTAGGKNFNLYLDLGNWNRQTKLGKAFDSSTIFALPNGARKSPDVSWVELKKWNRLTQSQQDGFPPIAPDFVIELIAPSRFAVPSERRWTPVHGPSDLKNQRYEDLQAKMQEYLDNGVKLGWLIEPSAKTVEIYRSNKQVEILNNPPTLSGEDILPGFTLDLSEIFI